MSAHFSKYMLNTYSATPYFQAHVPADYPLSLVLQKCRAFRRLPPRLRELSVLAKRWSDHNNSAVGYVPPDWYDGEGYELNPGTGKRLTDEEIDADWEQWEAPDIEVKDIPIPPGGFADPETWEEPKPEPVSVFMWGRSWPDPDDIPSEAQLLSGIASHGRRAVAREYSIPIDQLPKGKAGE